jgi:hypothetical protein
MVKNSNDERVTFKVTLEANRTFDGRIAGIVFDASGGFVTQQEVMKGQLDLPLPAAELNRYRVFLAPLSDDAEAENPTIKMMERLNAFEPVISLKGRLSEQILIPGHIVDAWIFCLCWVRGRVINSSSNPVCGARVHICEVDKLWRWIIRLPDPDIFRLRDDLIRVIEVPRIPFPPRPRPDPSPIDFLGGGVTSGNITSYISSGNGERSFNPQPEPPRPTSMLASESGLHAETLVLLKSTSASIVRDALAANVKVILPYLCLWPYWWRLRCDEIAVVDTDSFGRFQLIIPYLCSGDKPDLYFWVEYEINGSLETVYRPPMPCYTHWDYACGTDVTLHVTDPRVPGCGAEPDPGGCVVQVLSIGKDISMSEIHGSGAAAADLGLTTAGRPFGGRIEPRVWFSRSELRDSKNIRYYRWSCRRYVSGVDPDNDAGWIPLIRDVVRHYPMPVAGGYDHVPYALGPQPVGAEHNLFEITPVLNPEGNHEWTVVDEHEDLASAHFMTKALGVGTTFEERALDAAGNYELKMELFDNTGNRVDDWDGPGINLQIANVAAPFGTGTVTFDSAPAFNRIIRSGKTAGFYMMMHVDNNPCRAEISGITGTGLGVDPAGCGFILYENGAMADLRFRPYHPNDFATFSFSVVRGVTNQVHRATASGKAGASPIATNDPAIPVREYVKQPGGEYRETFPVTELLGDCTRGAFSEALHVWTLAVDGYGRVGGLDAFSHTGFALNRPCPGEK